MNTQQNAEIRELNAAELDSVSGGARFVEEVQDALTLVDMAVHWIVYGVTGLGRDPWA